MRLDMRSTIRASMHAYSMYAPTHVCSYVRIFVCIYACMYVCIDACSCIFIFLSTLPLNYISICLLIYSHMSADIVGDILWRVHVQKETRRERERERERERKREGERERERESHVFFNIAPVCAKSKQASA